MVSNVEVRAFLDKVALMEFGKKYRSLNSRQAAMVRKKAANIAFRRGR